MKEYKCKNGHIFTSETEPKACPHCGTLKFEVYEKRSTLKLALIIVSLIILLTAALILMLSSSEPKHDIKIDDYSHEGYTELLVRLNINGDDLIVIDEPEYLNKLNVVVDGEDYEFNETTENRIFYCSEGVHKVEVMGTVNKGDFSYTVDTLHLTPEILKIDQSKCKGLTNDPVIKTLELLSFEPVSNCEYKVNHNQDLGSVWISINGENGDYQQKELWSLKGLDSYTCDIWGYIDPDFKTEYINNELKIDLPGCKPDKKKTIGPCVSLNKEKIENYVRSGLTYNNLSSLRSKYTGRNNIGANNECFYRVSCHYVFKGKPYKISSLKQVLRNELRSSNNLKVDFKWIDNDNLRVDVY